MHWSGHRVFVEATSSRYAIIAASRYEKKNALTGSIEKGAEKGISLALT